jgi:hypothetical protein
LDYKVLKNQLFENLMDKNKPNLAILVLLWSMDEFSKISKNETE